MFVPYTVDVPMQRYPYANWALIGLTVLVTIGAWKAQPAALRLDPAKLEKLEELSEEELRQLTSQIREVVVPRMSLVRDQVKPLQLFSYALVHADFWHLAGNMLFLFCFGNAVNARLGHALFLVLYFALGAVAGAAWLLFDREGLALVGASGAIMGTIGIFFVLYPRNDVSLFYYFPMFTRHGIGSFEISAVWVILLYMVLDLVGTVKGGDGVAYISHLVGALFGIGACVALFAIGLLEPVYGEENLLQVLGFAEKSEPATEEPDDVPDLPVARAQKKRKQPAEGWGEM